MKYFKLISVTIILGVLPFLMNGQGRGKGYDFPIKPGSPEWKKLKTYPEKLNVYNLPDSVLKTISTADLVSTCLSYPELHLMITRNSLQDGYNYLKRIFNGFNELENRKDAGIELLDYYSRMDPSIVKNLATPIERGTYSYKLMYVEIIISQSNILTRMDGKTRRALLEKTTAVYDSIVNYPKTYGFRAHACSAFVMGRILKADNQKEFLDKKNADKRLNSFIEQFDLPSPTEVEYVVNQSRNQIKKANK